MAKWQEKYCEILLEMKRFNGREEDQGALTFVLYLAKALAGQSFPCCVDMRDALQFPKEGLAGALWELRAPEARAVRRMCGGAAHDHHGHFAMVEMELLVSPNCIAGCAE